MGLLDKLESIKDAVAYSPVTQNIMDGVSAVGEFALDAAKSAGKYGLEALLSSGPDTEHTYTWRGELSILDQYKLAFVAALIQFSFDNRRDDYLRCIVERLSEDGIFSSEIAKHKRDSIEFAKAFLVFRNEFGDYDGNRVRALVGVAVDQITILEVAPSESGIVTNALFKVEFHSGHTMKIRLRCPDGMFDRSNTPISMERPYVTGAYF